MSLHGRLEAAPVPHNPALQSRYEELEKKMLDWPRNQQNDPFFASSQAIAAELSRTSGKEVILGFNEFCAPSPGARVAKAPPFRAPGGYLWLLL